MLPLDGYQGLSGQRDVAGGVLVGMEFRHADLDTTLVLDLRLEKAGKTWRVVALEKLVDYALGLVAVQELRLAEVNRPTIERLWKDIAIGGLQRRADAELWSMSETVELGLPVTNRSGRPMSAVALKATYTAGGEEKTMVFETHPATGIGPGETALAVYRHTDRMMFASPEDRVLARADAASLFLDVIPVHAVFRDGEKADTVRVYSSWDAYARGVAARRHHGRSLPCDCAVHDLPFSHPRKESPTMLSALFDFSFSQFVTTRLIRVLYGLALVVAALFALAIGVGIMHDTEGFSGTVAGLAAIPIIFLVSALYSRVVLELTIVLFRIAEHTQTLASRS